MNFSLCLAHNDSNIRSLVQFRYFVQKNFVVRDVAARVELDRPLVAIIYLLNGLLI